MPWDGHVITPNLIQTGKNTPEGWTPDNDLKDRVDGESCA